MLVTTIKSHTVLFCVASIFDNVLKQMVLCSEPTNGDDYDRKLTFDKEDRLLQWLVVKHWNAIWIGIY